MRLVPINNGELRLLLSRHDLCVAPPKLQEKTALADLAQPFSSALIPDSWIQVRSKTITA
jgi:hypothetical protein